MIVNFTRNQALTTVSRVRLLPTWGKVLARVGQTVEADDIVAVANTYPQHHMLNISRGLGVSIENSQACVKRQIGDSIKEGSILAERGKSGRVVRAPKDGTILSNKNGIVLLQSNSKVYKLKAGFPGIISKVMMDQGVIIESAGAFVQGVWGNGNQASGSLTTFTSSPKEPLSIDLINNDRNSVVSFAAFCIDPAVFDFAEENNWKGMIVGSLPAKLVPRVMKLPFPVMILEGFGKVPINTYTYELLNSYLGRNISVDAVKISSNSKERPEFFIPAANDDIKPNHLNEEIDLKIGSKVRIKRGRYFGATGIIAENINEEKTLFPSGARSETVVIKLPDDEKTVFPLANIDVFM